MAYACDYCGKVVKLKSSVKRHEKSCFYNPIKKNCLSCKNYNGKTKGYDERFVKCDVVEDRYYANRGEPCVCYKGV